MESSEIGDSPLIARTNQHKAHENDRENTLLRGCGAHTATLSQGSTGRRTVNSLTARCRDSRCWLQGSPIPDTDDPISDTNNPIPYTNDYRSEERREKTTKK